MSTVNTKCHLNMHAQGSCSFRKVSQPSYVANKTDIKHGHAEVPCPVSTAPQQQPDRRAETSPESFPPGTTPLPHTCPLDCFASPTLGTLDVQTKRRAFENVSFLANKNVRFQKGTKQNAHCLLILTPNARKKNTKMKMFTPKLSDVKKNITFLENLLLNHYHSS